MKIIFLITVFLISNLILFAQQMSSEYIGDSRIDSVIMLHKLQNKSFPYIKGYRIQIYKESGNAALDSAWSIKNKFESKHPNIPAYISFTEPYYRVRVGDFRTRLDAIRFLNTIKRKYPSSWDIQDKINFPSQTNNLKF